MRTAKAVTAFIASVVTVLGVVLADNMVDAGEISSTVAAVIDAGLMLASTLGVYAVPNNTTK
jgi:hypothetical protein